MTQVNITGHEQIKTARCLIGNGGKNLSVTPVTFLPKMHTESNHEAKSDDPNEEAVFRIAGQSSKVSRS